MFLTYFCCVFKIVDVQFPMNPLVSSEYWGRQLSLVDVQQDEKVDILRRAVEAEQRVHLLAEELDGVRQALNAAQQQLLSMKSTVSKADICRQPSTSGASEKSKCARPIDLEPGGVEERIEGIVHDVKGLEELIMSVCRRSCTQNNSHADFMQIFSYFHQLKVRIRSGKFRLSQRAERSTANVRAFVDWAKVSFQYCVALVILDFALTALFVTVHFCPAVDC